MLDHLLFALIVLGCGAFAMVNGMNDLSGLIATLISTRALTIRKSQLLCVVGVWVGVLLGSDLVSKTVAVGMADFAGLSPTNSLQVWLGAIGGSVAWVALARRLGVPTSATHTFVGALCGGVIVGTMEPGRVTWGVSQLLDQHQVVGVMKVFAGLIASPLLGSLMGYLCYRLLAVTLRWATAKVNRRLRRGEWFCVLLQGVAYGLNDAHGVMGILTGACLSAGLVSFTGGSFYVPMAVKLFVLVALSVGASQGSLKILKMVGRGLIQVRPAEAISGQFSSAIAVLGASVVGAPVSSSQVTSSALVGVGGAWRPRHVRWKKVRDILMTWVITFPCALVIGALAAGLARLACLVL